MESLNTNLDQNQNLNRYEAVPEGNPEIEKAKAPDSPLLQNMKEHFSWFGGTACLYGLI